MDIIATVLTWRIKILHVYMQAYKITKQYYYCSDMSQLDGMQPVNRLSSRGQGKEKTEKKGGMALSVLPPEAISFLALPSCRSLLTGLVVCISPKGSGVSSGIIFIYFDNQQKCLTHPCAVNFINVVAHGIINTLRKERQQEKVQSASLYITSWSVSRPLYIQTLEKKS